MNTLLLIVIGTIVLFLGLVITQLLTPKSNFLHSKILLLPKFVQNAIVVSVLLLLSFLLYILIPIKTDQLVNESKQSKGSGSLPDSAGRRPATEIVIAKSDSGLVRQNDSNSTDHDSKTKTKKPGKQKNDAQEKTPSKSSIDSMPGLVEKKSVDMVTDTILLEKSKKELHSVSTYTLVTDREFQINQQTNTGIYVSPGDSLAIAAGGFVNMGPVFSILYGASTPDGIAGLEINEYNLWQNLRHGALIASVDNKHWTYCGSSRNTTSTHSGTLVFNINDRKQQDNTGFYIVNVWIYRSK